MVATMKVKDISQAAHRLGKMIGVRQAPGCIRARLPCMLNKVTQTETSVLCHAPTVAAPCRRLSSLAEQFQAATDAQRKVVNVQTVFRTEEDNPTNQTLAQEGLFYTVPETEVKQLFQKGLSTHFTRQAKTFNETCFMIRKPALEVIDCLKHLNFDHGAPRFLLYGNTGSGKTLTLAHIIHYCARNQWLVLHAPWPCDWNCRFHESSPSPHKPERVDLPVDAAEWLVGFRSQNSHLLQDIRLSKKYIWTKREVSEEGSSLTDLVEFGLNRMKFASDCVGAVMREVRLQAADKKIKVLVAVDGVNAFWTQTKIKDTDRKLLMADQISLVHNYKKMLQSTWTHGAVVCSVDAFANKPDRREHHTPRYLLGEEGYKWMDPFIPVHIPYYTEKEAYSCLEYYHDRNWLQHEGARTEEGKKELIFLSNKNPFQLMRICSTK